MNSQKPNLRPSVSALVVAVVSVATRPPSVGPVVPAQPRTRPDT